MMVFLTNIVLNTRNRRCFLNEGWYLNNIVALKNIIFLLWSFACYINGVHITRSLLCFTWYYIDPVRFIRSLPGAAKVFARPILNGQLEISGGVDMQAASKALPSANDGTRAERIKYHGMPHLECILHILFLPTLRLIFSAIPKTLFVQHGRHLGFHSGQKRGKGGFIEFTAHLVSLDCGRAGVALKKLLTRHL